MHNLKGFLCGSWRFELKSPEYVANTLLSELLSGPSFLFKSKSHTIAPLALSS